MTNQNSMYQTSEEGMKKILLDGLREMSLSELEKRALDASKPHSEIARTLIKEVYERIFKEKNTIVPEDQVELRFNILDLLNKGMPAGMVAGYLENLRDKYRSQNVISEGDYIVIKKL